MINWPAFSTRNVVSQSYRFQSPHSKRCTVCGRTLTVHEAAVGVVCNQTDCRHQVLKEQLAQQAKRDAQILERAEAVSESLSQSWGVHRDDHLLGVVPSNDRPFRPVPQRRLRAFSDRLNRVLSEAVAIRFRNGGAAIESRQDINPNEDAPSSDGQSKSENATIVACTTCRGQCCEQGGDHAFINVDTLLRYLAEHPSARPRDVYDAYLSRLGSRCYEGSCVYHGDSGCRLPRAMRSDLCNRFRCKGLTELCHQSEPRDSDRVVVVSISGIDSNQPRPIRASVGASGEVIRQSELSDASVMP